MIRPATIGEMDDVTRLALDSNRHWGYDDDFMERRRGELTVRGDDVREEGSSLPLVPTAATSLASTSCVTSMRLALSSTCSLSRPRTSTRASAAR